ncbi:Biotin and thiamine Synthesis associated domain [Rhizoctonia solani]|uniref:Biotin and thiamine Synthesis associated domain n=1 Tax=Rhizoctonia solani TaxID=456999 RepID=A0A8H7IGI7_9AGAM|nr:Biotin and thiamine Synthesis associated domain [Rhizoctonia solani]
MHRGLLILFSIIRYSTPTEASRLLQNEPVIQAALKAKENGSTRFCMGAAWRDLQGRKSGFNRILEMVREIRGMGMEVCTTLGMLSPEQARQLKEAGLTAYNHNLDTSREFYPKVITTRSYDERLATIEAVQDAGINVCSGGILGLGETDEDRVGLIWEVANMRAHPESFPVNALVPIQGTPLENNPIIPHQTILRTIATARIALPSTIIRLSAGRHKFSEAEQMMCFMAGANAVFTGEKMLTTPCSSWDEDKEMFSRWGLEGMKSFEQAAVREKELPRYPEMSITSSNTPLSTMRKVNHSERYRGLSCLAVGAGAGGSINMLARVTIIDYRGNEILDTYVQPTSHYRTAQTKITEYHLSGANPHALPFDVVQTKVTDHIAGCIVVGYTLWNDLSILGLRHPAIDTRDIGLYLPFRDDLHQPSPPKLPTLVWKFMQRHIQCSSIDSVSKRTISDTIFIAYQYNFAVQAENARACMDLFRCIEREWERYVLDGDWPCALPTLNFSNTIPNILINPESGPTPRQGSASTTAINPTTSAAYRLLLTSQPSTKHPGRHYNMQLATNEVHDVIVDLADLYQSEEHFIEEASRNAHIDKQHAWAVGNTIRTLILDDALPNAWPRFSIPALTLISVKGPLPDPKALKQTYDLTCTANSYAQRNFIGSLLAGPGSESDEFADVGFWCGEIDENNIETSILQSLSLGIWIQKGTITRLADAPLKTLRKSEMWESCEALSDLTEFRVERPDTGGRVMHVMAGKGLEGWCGMIGVGVWSDE